jgi:large subunit ribosomal protein L1
MVLGAKNLQEAMSELRSSSKKRNFNQSVELIINLRDVDMKKPEGRIQEVIELPHPLGKNVGVCVIATGGLSLRARRAGADIVLEREDLESLAGDKKRQRETAKRASFFIAEAPLMPLVGRVLGSILGPRGKMPTPVPPTADIEEIIERQRRMTRIRSRGQPTLECRVGTEDMSDRDLQDNIQAVIGRIERRLKRGMKNIDSVYLKLSMGPPIKVSI